MIPIHFLLSSKTTLPAGIIGMLGLVPLKVAAAKAPREGVLHTQKQQRNEAPVYSGVLTKKGQVCNENLSALVEYLTRLKCLCL